MIKILVVEDDKNISKLIKDTLEIANYEITCIYDGNEVLSKILSDKNYFDLILLDIMLPGIDGFKIIDNISTSNIPVIFISARDDVETVVKGLKIGAEDYIKKPFEPLELLARIELVLKRFDKDKKTYEYKNIKVDLLKRSVSINNSPIDLTLKEFDLLVLLIKNVNIALSRDKILNEVWGIEADLETRTVDYHIQQLRKKLNLKKNIVSISKIGYRLES